LQADSFLLRLALTHDHHSASGPSKMAAASNENAASHPEALLGPPAKSKATPVPQAPSDDSPNPTVECSAIVAPRWARFALALMPEVNAPESPETVNPYTISVNVLSCTMIVTNANALAGKVHDRMPVLLQPEDLPRWLAGTAGTDMLKSAPDDYLQVWPVSRQVNSSRAPSDDPTLIEQIAA
jgi:hypothetical protein